MKKFLALFLALVMVFALCACGSKTEAPKTDAPKTDAPAADAPKTDAPKTDAPKTDAPKTDAPKTDTPAATTSSAPEVIRIGAAGSLGRFLAGISPSESWIACDGVFDTVFRYDPVKKETFSDILESWEWTDDNTFVMKMKDCVYFSNGENATGEDLLFSYENHPGDPSGQTVLTGSLAMSFPVRIRS